MAWLSQKKKFCPLFFFGALLCFFTSAYPKESIPKRLAGAIFALFAGAADFSVWRSVLCVLVLLFEREGERASLWL